MALGDTYDFANYYGVDPWGDITLKERNWYDPLLRHFYQRASVYSQYVAMQVDMAGPGTPKARTIYFNDIISPHPNIAPIGNRQQESSKLYSDSYQREVRTARYGNGMSLHRESQLFSYWELNGGGTGFGLIPIINRQLGQVIVDHFDLLARNAYFSNPNRMFGLNSASSFAGIDPSGGGTSDKMTTELIDNVWLGMRDRPMPFSVLPQPYPMGNEIICITTAGCVHDLKREVGTSGALSFVEAQRYQQNTPLITGELGMYRGIRFIDNQLAKLENCGRVTAQTTITAAVVPGDGAADPATTLVEGVRRVGQPGATHYITVASTTGFEKNQRITIHRYRHDSTTLLARGYRGVLNGVDYEDPMALVIEIDSVLNSTTLILKEPYMMTMDNGKGLEANLGGGVYGYVTYAQNIHTALFLTPNNSGIIAGVAQQPILYTPKPNDDYESMYRVSYDFYVKYAVWEPRVFQMAFLVGANARFAGSLFY